ncbi:hypothetical protein PHMEG_0008152 [Phytophthora megakarya]|uniref:WW domain-containing protein n=1 Tax=Phytophthora megakarya TaxID=4795 RepID=A0A225WKA3_9STRA|nr:hypothetical protein PHMEG_0008152 [Phytophthora megakarya]
MERFVVSAPHPDVQPSSRPSVSPVSVSPPTSVNSASLPLIPFSAIQNTSDDGHDDVHASDSDLIPRESDSNVSIHSIPDNDILSERQLIARGRILLQAYQSQKKQWLQNEYDSREGAQTQDQGPDSNVNIFHPMDSNGEYSNAEYSSPPKKPVIGVNAPPIDTKLEDLPPPPPPASPPPTSMVSGLSNFSIAPPPTSELKMNQPLSGNRSNRSEKSWTDFMKLLKHNGRMMDMVDEQLAEIWGELVSDDEKARGPQTSVEKLSEAVTQLLQQKREAEIAIAKLAEVLGSRVFLTGKMTDDAVQFVSNQLRMELEASQTLVEKVKMEKHSYQKENVPAVNGRSDEIAKFLRQELQDQGEQLQASQAAVAKLKDQLLRQQESAANKQEQFERALDVKLREIDALCSHVELPGDYERVKTIEGVTCYRKSDDGDNELEDPRVPIAIQQRSAAVAATLVDAVNKENTAVSGEVVSSENAPRARGISAMARDYAAPDNIMRRSFSTPHISHDSNVFEDIHVPPDDGRKHTIEDFSTPLPAGWEMRVTASGAVFFFNKYTTTTTWTDPRLLEPYDELVAVNKNARNLNRPQRPMPPLAAPLSDGGDSVASGSDELDIHLDEEVLIDEGTVIDLEQLRVPVASSQIQDRSASGDDEDEDMNVADVIISNIFSLFWKPPETTGEVHTV